MQNERFGKVYVHAPWKVADTVIFFSDSSQESSQVRTLLQKSKNVIIDVDTNEYLKHIDKDSGCSYLAGEIERLSQTAQSEAGIEIYKRPVLVGVGQGASLAFAIMMQSPDTFLGLQTVSFCPSLSLKHPLCDGDALTSTVLDQGSISLSPSKVITSQWSTFEFRGEEECSDATVESLVKRTPNAQLIPFEGGSFEGTHHEHWISQFYEELQSHFIEIDQGTLLPDSIKDLPIIASLPKNILSDYFFIFISGDGGWAYIDKGVAKVFNQAGIPVIGINALKYFWKEKTPKSVAEDIERIVDAYTPLLGMRRFSIGGFSMGAEVSPFIYNHMSTDYQKRSKFLQLIAPGTSAEFEVHIGDWLGMADDSDAKKIAPELKRVSVPIFCVTGDDEDESSVCKEFSMPNLKVKLLKGGHHFDGDYELVGKELLELGKMGVSQKEEPTDKFKL